MMLPVAVMLSEWHENQFSPENTKLRSGDSMLSVLKRNAQRNNHHPTHRNPRHIPPNRGGYSTKQEHSVNQNKAFTWKTYNLLMRYNMLRDSPVYKILQKENPPIEGTSIIDGNQSFTTSPPTSKKKPNDRIPPPSSIQTDVNPKSRKPNFPNPSSMVDSVQNRGHKFGRVHQSILAPVHDVPIPEETLKKPKPSIEVPECDLSIEDIMNESKNGLPEVDEVESPGYNFLPAYRSTPLLEAVRDANEKLSSLTNGYTLYTINPFIFLETNDYEEEMMIHRTLHASKVAFLMPDSEGKKCTSEKIKPEHQITNDLLKKAMSSKLSVNAEPFKFKPPPPSNGKILGRNQGKEVFMDFVSRIDKKTMISLAPSETSSVPLFCHLELDEFGGIQVQDYEQNLLNLAAERTRQEEDFGDVEDLQGEELTPEDIERAESSCHGAIGTELDEEGNEVPVRRDSSRDIKIMYGGRDILDLGANLRSEFWELNRWQRGPEPMRPAEPAPIPAPTNSEPSK
ncbi:uncharacterized protein LOC123310738 [Coccinella septempunctata]|uniref:uncharacterized protein LOC123310738 n=1 Tax=Coccinella septempunctata TaxID=41139 RepID=UPI001D060E69|nr:uncharacterized protein LOC123310738 [Coccinella septempunctata]